MSAFPSNFSNSAAGKIRLLLAEDSQGTRHNLINLLGFEKDIEVVGAVGRGTQAIELARQLYPDVVLMDINMPDMDGLTATSQILQISPIIAVVVMSVQDEESYQRRALQAGAFAFLVKPFSADDLVNTIRAAAGR
ncbi:MAG: response regulator receiver protein [Chloroflexi bacterium]|jgi:DNA-binding NarL/FixJ family response regulator|nr:response regulator receiver protein [Chloroflexota bacterium]